MSHNSLLISLIGVFTSALATASFAFSGDDFVAASHDPKTPDKPAIVLRVPKAEQYASVWDPKTEKLPYSPEEAVKLVFESDLVRDNPKDWRLVKVSFWAMHPRLFSDLSIASRTEPGLITHYSIDLISLPDGWTYPLMIPFIYTGAEAVVLQEKDMQIVIRPGTKEPK